MATRDGIYSICEAIIRLLRANRDPAAFGRGHLDFEVYVARNFESPMTEGVSLFLYRIYHNGTLRSPVGRTLANGKQRTKLPVDLHFLLTAWAQTASRQHEIAGWMMRVLEDHMILPASVLNAPRPGVFQPDEQVEVVLTDLTTEDLFRIWNVMINHVYQLSVPYVARRLEIESDLLTAEYPLVSSRTQDGREIVVGALSELAS